MKQPLLGLTVAACLSAGAALADTSVTLHQATDKGPGDAVGQVTISQTDYGLVFTPDLKGLEPGIHGFHVHANGNCDAKEEDGKMTPAGAAGGHLDPENTGKHGAPWGDGHLGDLPALYVLPDGTATQPVLAPRLKSMDQIQDKALMVHKGGDNHADHPEPLGGGGARVACGVIQ
ncbi:superoxide dismutase [Cu-Zn] SodC1 [Verticiella sediminum]|uniref:Superoxide dismutase [Cu-Zn] n=1 Tax=Verticiella sediminum TaxID=1247510 RepID=A0A556AB45_9BURK|nr:superoxide dismutase family protein [Verticiella sediminum]TSH90115.1 superoxide dismutase [Cu-Zn] SodC1 [Verticiella sediminum]